MIGRASTLLTVAAVGLALTGCQTTQEKSAELQRQAEREQQREAAEAARTETAPRPSTAPENDSDAGTGADR